MQNSILEYPETSTDALADMILIPAGDFLMGSDYGSEVEKPVRRVFLHTYYLDATPVTNTQFATFVEATGYRTTAERLENLMRSQDGQIQAPGPTWRAFATPDRKDHPVVYISWHDADAYAKWVGKRLPTEAEWEKAARGGLIGKLFPWGNAAPEGRANWNRTQANPQAAPPTTPVASFAPNDYGLYDMAGNVWEWCADWYLDPYYAIGPSSDPAGPERGQYKVRRGASWNVREDFRLRCANRGAMLPDRAWPNLGFRCAMSTAAEDRA
jgi:sulfatase modifying factor 1